MRSNDGPSRDDWSDAVERVKAKRAGVPRGAPRPQRLLALPSGRWLPAKVRSACAGCDRLNGEPLPPRHADQTLVEKYVLDRGVILQRWIPGVDPEYLEGLVQINRLRAQIDLKKEWIALLERSTVESARRVRWASSDFAHAVECGAVARAKAILRFVEHGPARNHPAANVADPELTDLELTELMGAKPLGRARRPDRARSQTPFVVPRSRDSGEELRTQDGRGGTRGRPKSPGVRDQAEAERLLMVAAGQVFPGATTAQVRSRARRTHADYPRLSELVHRLLRIDRSVTAESLAAALAIKKTKLYGMADEGAPVSAVAA